MLKVCDGCKDGLDTDQDGSLVSTNGAALAPFRANGAHSSIIQSKNNHLTHSLRYCFCTNI